MTLEGMAIVGVREVVALGALGVAGFIAFMYLDPASTEERAPAGGDIHLGSPPPTVTPTPAPTATPVPVTRLAAPSDWLVRYFEAAHSGGDLLVGSMIAERVGISAQKAAFADMRDDAWSVTFEREVTAAAGRNGFAIEYDCELKVFVDGAEVAREPNPDGSKTTEVRFDHKGGAAMLVIEARDTGGPFLVRWVD